MQTIACEHCGLAIPVPIASSSCPECGNTISSLSVGEGETVAHDPQARANEETATQIEGTANRETVGGHLPVAAIPGYSIVEELGRGGMGVVYKAHESSLNRSVALKVLLSGIHAGSRELARFRSEGEAAAAVQHPNIVQVFAVGQHAGLPYMALEFVPGGSLAQRLAQGPLEHRETARIVQAIARGVQAAHAKGVVHRDLKPANVLFDSTGEPKVADFGIAKMEESGLTATGAIMGTPAYMAPEQARGDTKLAGPPADIWALGVILFECLSGRPPFLGNSAPQTLRLVCEADPHPLKRIPKDLETIALTCLQKDLVRRYSSAAELADDLGRFLAGDAVKARRQSPVVRAMKWVKRHPSVSYVVAGAFLAVAVSLITLSLRPKKDSPAPTPVVEEKLPSDLLLVPPDAFAFVTARPWIELDRPVVQRMIADFFRLEQEVRDAKSLAGWMEKQFGIRADDVERLTLVMLNERFRQGLEAPNLLIVMRTKTPANLNLIREHLEGLIGKFDVAEHRSRKYYLAMMDTVLLALWKAGENDLVFGQVVDVEAAIDRLADGQTDGVHAPTLELASQGHSLVAGAKSIGPLADLFEGDLSPAILTVVKSLEKAGPITLTADLLAASKDSSMPGIDLEFRIQFEDETEARAALPKLRASLVDLGKPDEYPANGGLKALFPALRKSLRELGIEQAGPGLIVTLKPRWSEAEVVASGKKATLSAEEKLRLIGNAMHNYHDTFGHLPTAATRSADGKPLYSWRVEMLPFLEHDSMYRQFQRDSPWDHPQNKALIEKMPAIFAMDPGDPGFAKNRTRFQVIETKGGIFDGTRLTKLAEISDGTSNTLMLVEAGEPVEWTRPDSIRFEPKGQVPRLGNPLHREALILRADASAVRIPRDISATLFQQILTKNGGEAIDWNRLGAKR